MPRIPNNNSVTNGASTRRPQKTVAAITQEIAGGKTPEQVFESRPRHLASSAVHASKLFPNYRFDSDAVDAVMKKYGIGDVKALLRTAIALDDGDRYLNINELEQAAQKVTPHSNFKFNPTTLADVMTQKGIGDQSALLHAAEAIDKGDHYLSRQELERAADVLLGVIAPHDVATLIERTRATASSMNAEIETLGHVEGLPVLAVTVRAKTQPPALRVFVSGGVHGSEPCGAAAAVLLLEQLKAKPELRENVEFTIIPAVNPRALAKGSRRTPEDVDLNRTLVTDDDSDPQEAHFMRAFLKKNKCDLALDLHSGKSTRNGFWVLHKQSAALAEPAMQRFAQRWPVLQGDTKPYTMSVPGVAVSSSTETLKDLAHKMGATWSFTVEAPGSVSYLDQVLGENEIAHQMIREALTQISRP